MPAVNELPPPRFDDGGSSFSSSQDSNTSTVSTSAPALTSAMGFHKRGREDVDEEESDLDFQPASPRLLSIGPTSMPSLDRIRPLASPRTRRKDVQSPAVQGSKMLELKILARQNSSDLMIGPKGFEIC